MTETTRIYLYSVPDFDYATTWSKDSAFFYIGRKSHIPAPESIFANHYSVEKYGRKKALQMFRDHYFATGLSDRINLLVGHSLACHCQDDEECHGDFLVDQVYEYLRTKFIK